MIEIFFSYSHADEVLMNSVRQQLIVFEREKRILKWHDRMIPPGSAWKSEIDSRMNTSDIILLFLSPDFIESKYCYEVEGQEAIKRHDAGLSIVIPVILRPCAWQASPFGKYQGVPKDGKPISTWPNQDEATLDAAMKIMSVVDRLQK
ncbi:toll/interleukin-1 receptor domain-containing protein [Tolumonas lignilytica]|uniref:toll/interleukin-1 receptor domain-containing protein n=1 Tax=Tolumonas lignilytica TaxID=1283284 RepID=UPI000465A2B8|nr:toll/interleukin-1 receptor domain-containing protein [Tolumonas lignilytica]